MSKNLSSIIKRNFERATSEDVEILTFEDLSIGESYISFPEPGDNKGHGGLKKSYYVFIKTKTMICEGEEYNSKRKFDSQLCYFKEDFPVIKVL